MIISQLVRDAMKRVLETNSAQSYLRYTFGNNFSMDGQQVITLSDLIDSSTGARLKGLLQDIVIASDEDWKQDTLKALDLVYAHDFNERKSSFVDWRIIGNRVAFGKTEIGIFHGDITTLKTDAIVNAANDQGLGCFVPSHGCIDNTIHRWSGPLLRKACREAMVQRSSPLSAGTVPIVTHAYNLPSQKVIHVTGPQVGGRMAAPPTELQRNQLAAAYWNCLDACVQHELKSIAFCSISTGLFGFPKLVAAQIAVHTVLEWLKENPGTMDAVVFDVFANEDEDIYKSVLAPTIQNMRGSALQRNEPSTTTLSLRDQKLATVAEAIRSADAVLICAGAGMSVKEGEMVYTNPNDFAKHYPWFTKWGYKTSYEVMGLGSDPTVPEEAKWALHAKHMDNMRWKFEPNQGYKDLLGLVQHKDYFVLTSNVDGCFERAGFDPKRIYTPQGEWTYYQCMSPCRKDAVFKSRPLLDQLVPLIGSDGMLPKEAVPKCPFCGGRVFGNVRGGSWFLHTNYQEQNNAIRRWMANVIESRGEQKKTAVVLEIGAGFNTPTVTRFPMESFVRELGSRGALIRINPSDDLVPNDVRAVSFKEGWQVLRDIADAEPTNQFWQSIQRGQAQLEISELDTQRMAMYFGHFDWDRFLSQLKD